MKNPSHTSARLLGTEQGRALLALLDAYPSQRALAKALGSSSEYISRCVKLGQISKSGALLADRKGLMAKELLRPDVTDWDSVPSGPIAGAKPSRDGAAQVLLRDLAIHFGSVKDFCQAADIKVRNFHDWLSRGRISPQGMLKLVALKGLSRELRAKVKAAVDSPAQGG